MSLRALSRYETLSTLFVGSRTRCARDETVGPAVVTEGTGERVALPGDAGRPTRHWTIPLPDISFRASARVGRRRGQRGIMAGDDPRSSERVVAVDPARRREQSESDDRPGNQHVSRRHRRGRRDRSRSRCREARGVDRRRRDARSCASGCCSRIRIPITGPRPTASARRPVRSSALREVPKADEVKLDLDLVLNDGDTIDGTEFRLEALHTPGHAPNHCASSSTRSARCSPAITCSTAPPRSMNPQRGGDMVAVPRVARTAAQRSSASRAICPGHGDVMEDPPCVLEEYVAHASSASARSCACSPRARPKIHDMVADALRRHARRAHRDGAATRCTRTSSSSRPRARSPGPRRSRPGHASDRGSARHVTSGARVGLASPRSCVRRHRATRGATVADTQALHQR